MVFAGVFEGSATGIIFMTRRQRQRRILALPPSIIRQLVKHLEDIDHGLSVKKWATLLRLTFPRDYRDGPKKNCGKKEKRWQRIAWLLSCALHPRDGRQVGALIRHARRSIMWQEKLRRLRLTTSGV